MCSTCETGVHMVQIRGYLQGVLEHTDLCEAGITNTKSIYRVEWTI